VSAANSHTGMFSAMDTGNIELRQDFTPTPGSEITDVSFWFDNSLGFLAFYFSYTDGSDEQFVAQGAAGQWSFVDATSDVETGKSLSGFSIFGADPDITTFVDDVSITAQVNTTAPEPATFSLLGSGGLILLGALRRRSALHLPSSGAGREV